MLPKNTWGENSSLEMERLCSPPGVKFTQTEFQGHGQVLLVRVVGGPPAWMTSPPSSTGHPGGNALHPGNSPYMLVFSDKGRILKVRTTSVLLTPMCSSVCGI